MFFVFLGLFQPILALNEATMVIFLIFLNFFLFFWNFLLRVRLERNRTIVFIFSLSQPIFAFLNLFLLQMKPKWYSSNFLNFFGICLEFSVTHWVGTKRNDNLYFLSFSAFFNQFSLEKKRNEFFCLNFFAIVLWIFYYASSWNKTEW